METVIHPSGLGHADGRFRRRSAWSLSRTVRSPVCLSSKMSDWSRECSEPVSQQAVVRLPNMAYESSAFLNSMLVHSTKPQFRIDRGRNQTSRGAIIGWFLCHYVALSFVQRWPIVSEEVPIKYQPLFQRVGSQGAKSKADAIKAFCLRCVGFHSKRVTSCTSPTCPLYKVRPYQKGVVEL